MTSPNQASVGNVHADIVPDVSGFKRALEAKLGALRLDPVNIAVDANTRAAAASLAAFRAAATRPIGIPIDVDTRRAATRLAAFRATASRPIDIPVDVSTRTGAGSLAALRATVRTRIAIPVDLDTRAAAASYAALRALVGTPIDIPVDIDTGAAAASLAAFIAAYRSAIAGLPPIRPGGGTAGAGRAGAADGGTYAATFRSAVAAALQNLPEPTIGAATGPAEQAIRDVRLSLERLGRERVGITISAEQARAEAARIRTDLARIQAMSPVDVDVEANARAAQLVLDRLEGQLANIGRERRANVRVNVNRGPLDGLTTALIGSTSRMQLLVTAGLALGPAIVPAAAAAAAAIAGIGGAAISAVAGLGVGVLAISGVVGAVKALNDARNEQAKTAAQLVRQDNQLASGADQVRSAVASLANTRAQAATAARQSANQIADAERSLADAQRDALRAQQDITRAREEAKDALEDLDSAVKNNALSIRQANLDLAEAKENLDKVLSDPTATRRQREEAQLAYDRAKQQIDDLTVRQGRLKEEQAASAKAGVEGSQQVVAAQDKYRDAQQRVQDAERALAEARIQAAEQARQSAFSIAQAQQAVVQAQRSAANSVASAAATTGGAMDELQRKMDGLSPAGQRFARFIVGLQPHLLALRREAEQALPGFQRGIEAVLPSLPQVENFIRRIALALGDLGADIGTTLNSNRVRPFFEYIGNTAVPTMDSLFRSIGRIGIGLGNMVVAFAPAQRQIVGGFDEMSRRFEAFTAGLGSNNRFQQFIEYALTRGPIVMRTIGDIGGALIHILEAAAPAGDALLGILSALSRVIEAIPVPVLTTLLTVMIGLRVAALLAAVPLGAIGTTLSTLPGRIIAMTTSLGAARAGFASFAAFLGGPWTIAIAAATIVIGYLIAQSQKSKADAEGLRNAYQGLADALKGGVTPAALDNAKAILANSDKLRGLVELTQRAGLSAETLIRGINGERDARAAVLTALNAEIAKLQAAEEAAKRYNARTGTRDTTKESEAIHKSVVALQAQAFAFDQTSHAQERANALTNALAQSFQRQGQAAADLQPKIDSLQRIYDALTKGGASATVVADAFRNAIDAFTKSTINAIEAEERQIATNIDMRKALNESSAGFDLNTAKTDAQRSAILRNRDALQAALLATREKMLADIAAGVSLEEAAAKNKARIDEILKEIPASQRNTEAVKTLVAAYGTVPKEVATAMKATGVDAVLQQLKTLKAAQLALDLNISGADAMARIESGNQYRVFAATGGPVYGPGGPTDDRVRAVLPIPGRDPIRYQLSAGEFIQPAHSVDYYGQGFMEAIRHRTIPREALGIRYRATGGPVEEWDFPVSAAGTRIPSLEEVRARVYAGDPGAGGEFPPWPSSPGAQRGDTGVWRKIVALIKSTGPVSGSFGNAYRHGDPLWHGCVPMDTTILTRRGWIHHDQIVVGEDETIGYNPQTGKNEWTLIVGLHRYEDAELWKLQNKWFTAEVTPGHKWLVDQQVTVQTETVCTECGREFASGRGMTKHRADVHGVLTPRRERYVEQLVATRDFKQSTKVHLSKPADLGDKLPITDDEAELIGWIFADGYMEPYGPTIVQSKPEEVQYLKGFMAKFPHTIYRRQPQGRQRFEIFRFALSWEYWQDLASRSKASKTEALDFVLHLSVSQRQAFVRGFLSADGTRDPRTQNERLGYAAFQVSGPVAEAIKVAAYLEGYRPDTRVNTQFDAARYGTQPMELIGFRTSIVKSRNLPVVAKRTADVWCPTTTLGTWTARQGEEIFLTGNSGRAVDWMGYNQDALSQFFMRMQGRLLEFIHRTSSRDYAVTRGRNRGSFSERLMNEHRNHIHVAMADGGMVQVPRIKYDTGGALPPGLTLADNRTGGYEYVNTADQQRALVSAATGGRGGGEFVHIDTFNAYSQDPHEIARDLDWRIRHRG